MSDALEGTAALVTGAGSGIGAATATALARTGAGVALVGRRRGRLAEVAAAVTADGGRALVLDADITDRAAVRHTVETAVRELGRLDTLVNNAGVMLTGPVADAPEEEWERMLAVNLQGVLTVTRAALPHLTAAAESSPRQVADVVTVSSTAGRVARPGNAVYSLTKFGVGAFSEALRQELRPRRVRVGVVEPGSVATELTTHIRDGVREAAQERVAAIEQLRPEDIADAVVYMVTRERRVAVNEMLVRAGAQTW